MQRPGGHLRLCHSLLYCHEASSLADPEAGWPASSQNSSVYSPMLGLQACPAYYLVLFLTQVTVLAN